MNAYTIKLEPTFQLDEDKFYQLCRQNPDLKLESNHQRAIIIMSPTGGETGNRNADLTGQFWLWNRQNKLGKVFDSSTCFRLPNGANRSPDVSWVKQARWDELTPAIREKFPTIAPDFVLELMSPSDSLKETQEKMQEYRENGVKLGWLINPPQGQVEVYRPGREKEVLDNPGNLSGEDILPGFVLDLEIIFGSNQ